MRTGLHIVLQSLKAAAIVVAIVASAGCSTGIEGTKKIKMTKEDVKLMAKTPEQKFSENILGVALTDWNIGRKFMALSDRTLYIFDPVSSDSDLLGQSISGKALTYVGLDSYTNPDLTEECVILFSDGEQTLRYKTGKPTQTALQEIDSSKLPLISDIELIDQWKEKIKGKTLWTKSNLWYDSQGNRLQGLKFAKIKVEDVVPSIGDFPMKVKISGPDGKEAWLQMNYTSDTHDSRNFAAVFFLSDPKDKYPQISEENWKLIQKGKVGLGMTKEECKLSIGNPDELRTGHNRVQTMDIWQYSDGTYLFFTDGLLNEFRQ